MITNFTIKPIHKNNKRVANIGRTKQRGPIIPLDGEIWKQHPFVIV